MISIAGAVLIGWLFVGRHLVHRMVRLAGTMRDMAEGDLEAPVTVSGNDEVTDMANSLEVFRRYALEVQRLNLVEKLAQELDGKNKDLEQASGTSCARPRNRSSPRKNWRRSAS